MSEDRQVSVGMGTASDAEGSLDAICDLYDDVFSAPPFLWPEGESVRHRESLHGLIRDSTFGFAWARASKTLIGFVYGVELKAGTDWWEGFHQPIPAAFTEEWPGRTFAVIDLAVQRFRRRAGLGRELLDTLLHSRTEDRATLAVQPRAADTHAFYRAVGGWRLVGRQDTREYESAQFDVYVRDLAKP
ncbi:GNAT family N-acetyltransferase [Nocardia wallacei]|uniref:GNAT family N-acetyltransferase n=1 Tax=Nocardia wallacei TaxID=480035 RepID=UPI002457EA03|nr:GNAT family N-acetyltransferase [Nocardia wallacei]